jgi:hypothetical protein
MSQIGGCTTCAGPQGQLQELLNSYRQKNLPEGVTIAGAENADKPQAGPRAERVTAVAESDARQDANPGDIQSVFNQLGEGARGALIGAQSGSQAQPKLTGLDAALDTNGDGVVSLGERIGDLESQGEAASAPRLLTEAIVDHQRAAQSYYASIGTQQSDRGLGVIV